MIRLFAYLNFSLVLSTALILSSNAFLLRTFDGLGWLVGVAFSTSVLYFLLSRKVLTRYMQKEQAFPHSEWGLSGVFALPPLTWISLNYELTTLEPVLILFLIFISLLISTAISSKPS